jgi:hypothetical protein
MWKFVGESVMGSAHRVVSLPCQDNHAIVYEATSQTLIAVGADGAGSASHSRVGSAIACSELIACCERYFRDGGTLNQLTIDIVKAWIAQLQQALDAAAKTHEVNRRELSTTLLAALVGTDCSCFLQIGDGAIVMSVDGGFTTAFWPQSGEYVNTTMFVTDTDAAQSLQFKKQDGSIDQVAIFTDGIERLVLKFQDQSVHAPFFTQMFQAVVSLPVEQLQLELREFLDSDAVNARTDDDKTLILACRDVG